MAQAYERALPIAEAERRAARLRDERRAPAAPARLPAAPGGAGLVRHEERQVAGADHPAGGALHGLPERRRLPALRRRRRARRAGHAHAAALADGPARRARLHDPRASPRARAGAAARAAPGRATARSRASRCPPTAATPSPPPSSSPPLGPAAWRGWRFPWDAAEGEHVLCSRATDAAGNTQPLEPPWNLKGYANNAVERIRVVVRAVRAVPLSDCAARAHLQRHPAHRPQAPRQLHRRDPGLARGPGARRSRRSTASSTCTPRASPTTRGRCPATCSTPRRC